MLGMADMTVGLAWILTVGAMVFGVVYGAVNWNSEGEDNS